MTRLLPALLLALALPGCGETETVTLRQPATGFVTRCEAPRAGGEGWLPRGLLPATASRACPAGEAALAWERVD